jgi:parallel beta-helix repeat protein
MGWTVLIAAPIAHCLTSGGFAMRRTLLAVVSLFVVGAAGGCHQDNPQSCQRPENVGKDGCPPDASPMGGGPCMNNNDCAAAPPGLRVCDLTKTPAVCVQCTTDDHAQCGGVTPVCTNNICAACTKHSDCADSGACRPDGSCAEAASVAYVDGDHGTDGAPCTKDLPCTKIDKAIGMKPLVKVSGTVTDRATLDNRTGTIIADAGAKLAPRTGDNGVALEVKGGSDISIYDLQISNANNGHGISTADTANLSLTRVTVRDNGGNGIIINNESHVTCVKCLIASNMVRGIDASGGAGRLTISQSTISDNLNGGIRLQDDASFQIISNIIFRNGQSTKTAAAGILVQVNEPPSGAPPNRLDFNTLSLNMSSDSGQGIQCTAVAVLEASSNIIYDNGLAPLTAVQVSGNGCHYTYSDIGPVGIGVTDGNMMVPPGFDAQSSKPLHLSSASLARHMADPGADLRGLAAIDVDGDPRVAPADIGADQLP